MLATAGTYANKKRKKPVLKQKKVLDGNEVVKSNPSKRHRDRLNGELDRLTDLLPFPDDVRSCLDKLSVLRLSVGYLRVKSYFKATLKNNTGGGFPGANGPNGSTLESRGFSEGDLLLQALNGFVLVVTSDGVVFYASPTIKEYLGFQQSDVVHQSVFDLIHTDDRGAFRQNLHFALNPPDTDGECMEGCMSAELYNPDQLPPENSSFLERSFVSRFRCLLDNSSGFLALKFQGRLKFLHGQNLFRDNGTRVKPQLALFAVGTPVQPPSIVEIRSKMLLFQSKHKLDFTPMGIDNRGKIILGYSEMELCMNGSGYQFIHAADMMYCADNHLRMMKTGETGLTTFRLLSKSGNWVWVKSNAKLFYKGGRPDFIIAYQRAIVNAEGEDYLRQRRLQLPFSIATGEAVLYNTGPTMDLSETHINQPFNNNDVGGGKETEAPRSLLDCFLRQDKSAYSQIPETPLPVDQVFMDSRALVSVPSDAWQETGTASTSSATVVVKEEAKQSVMAVIDSLQVMAQNGDFCAALENMEVGDAELMEWEETLKRLGQEGDRRESVRSELDSVLINELFEHIDSVLFKDKGEECPTPCLKAVISGQRDPFKQPTQQQQDGVYPQMNGSFTADNVHGHLNTGLVGFNSPKLSHCGPLRDPANQHPSPPPQQLQLQDIFTPEIELPQLTVPESSCDAAPLHFLGFEQQQNNFLPVNQPIAAMISCNNLNGSTLPTACPQANPDMAPQNHHPQQWSQGPYMPTPSDVMRSRHGTTPAPESQPLPRACLWPRGVNGLDHAQQGGLACGQAVNHSSCMYTQPFTCGPAGGDTLALAQSSLQRAPTTGLDQSPPQGSCYFQWGHSQPVVGTSSISQDTANISPMTSKMVSSELAFNLQCYQE
ncbi:aryl hydrocarbon receptor-like [Dunckerocampus dactyliophorus]|uniref:aryl hydrocarbon receptor-like n=1 Tax=Dunckerocampus dactyliophorus TaxID=161453 RepID=UPI0024075531|nr:aryl hydrocarbon receptor-like [Dunckerocampus dactyliophorus]XP_054642170.1 aryl hydrocarbon receptor-like [Dunckerocampus dactyliophorus]XP_054642171.1 aryl hydrocarbon receptor-like [Dunckerocampus dactyliophorus]XP_054642173.1 aryl hydrocarbon receptor-like [Dunckerocampus dactyliophorus]XP_054642174.1 aryl hydrocarbon receptor-like [Dunckerocampus dactyliophorus]XP_054642175.1 aryl hydrocarbon receptor-like [Dunckerocampus dactyliophorus]XP_054642176.1 aryl hydrocarbon receptor-like [